MLFDKGADLGTTKHDNVDLCIKDVLEEVEIVVETPLIEYHIPAGQVPKTTYVSHTKLAVAALTPSRQQ